MERIFKKNNFRKKRLFDFFLSLILIIFASPVILCAWIIASLETKSNGFYLQKRVGRNSKLFLVFKIKTMFNTKLNSDYSVTTSNDKRITFMIKKCKNFSSYISFVDSYGAFEMQDTISFFKKIKKKFPEINSGCHFHNNCGLALANSILAFNEGVNLEDATFGGFGRGAGNAETEMFLVNAFNSKLKLSGFFYDKFIDEINKMKSEMQWGASFIYGYAAKTGVSQAYIMDLIQKKRLTTSEAIDDVKKTKENKNLAKEKISFLGDQNFNFLKKKKIIILGASESLKNEIFYLIQKYPKKVLVLSGKNA